VNWDAGARGKVAAALEEWSGNCSYNGTGVSAIA